MEKDSIKEPRREGNRNVEMGGRSWEEQSTGDFSETNRKDEGMSKIENT